MKYLLIGVSILITFGGALHGQTDEQNLEKYWKLRNDFRDYFVKIGSEQGASIPANALIPGGCVDNVTPWNANLPNGGQQVFGSVHRGDGTFYIGHYLSLLATEYRLLKNSGQDLTGIRNELYYTINAINRLDLNAEVTLVWRNQTQSCIN